MDGISIGGSSAPGFVLAFISRLTHRDDTPPVRLSAPHMCVCVDLLYQVAHAFLGTLLFLTFYLLIISIVISYYFVSTC